MRNVLPTMREDVEQKSNDHHPVRWHWRVGDWGNSDPARCSSVTRLLPHPASSAAADWGRSDGLVHKVGKTEPYRQLERFKFSRFLLSHLFVGWSQLCSSLVNASGRSRKHVSRKVLRAAAAAPLTHSLARSLSLSHTRTHSFTLRPEAPGAELCRSCTGVWQRRSSTVVQLELRSQCWVCVAHLRIKAQCGWRLKKRLNVPTGGGDDACGRTAGLLRTSPTVNVMDNTRCLL